MINEKHLLAPHEEKKKRKERRKGKNNTLPPPSLEALTFIEPSYLKLGDVAMYKPGRDILNPLI